MGFVSIPIYVRAADTLKYGSSVKGEAPRFQGVVNARPLIPPDTDLKKSILGKPQLWLSQAGVNPDLIGLSISRMDWHPKYSEGAFTPSRIFFEIYLEE